MKSQTVVALFLISAVFVGPGCNGDGPTDRDPCVRDSSSFPPHEQTWAEAVAVARAEADAGCTTMPILYLGTCGGSEALFVSRSGGFFGWTAFYDPSDGQLLGLTDFVDVAADECAGRSYWPMRIECVRTVTDALCG